MKIATAQIAAARNRIPDFIYLDITVKSGKRIYAPTWEMVMGYKRGRISEEEYTSLYKELMRKSFQSNKEEWKRDLRRAENKTLVLLCYCRKGDFCHRHLLKYYFVAVATQMGIQNEIIPE